MEIFLWILFGLSVVAWLFFKLGKDSNHKLEIVVRTEYSGPSREDKPEFYTDKDNWEQFDFYKARMLPAKGNYHILYTDQKGLSTERNITIQKAYDDCGTFAIKAMCHLRGSNRTFIDDRIKNAVDLDTGEIVQSVAQHSIRQYEETDTAKMWKAIGDQSVYLYVLCYVCRVDGRMMKVERDILADFIKRRNSGVHFNDTELDYAIKTLGAPDLREFKRLVLKMGSEDIEILKDVTYCAKKIVNSQKTIDPTEKAAIEILEKTLEATN